MQLQPVGATPSAFTTPAIQSGPTKLFVGSVPTGTTQQMLIEKFSELGQVAEVFLKNDTAEAGRMWGFVTYVQPESAAAAVSVFNEKMVFPGGTRPLAVSYARTSGPAASSAPAFNPGLVGAGAQFSTTLAAISAVNPAIAPASTALAGPTKLFIGSIPDGTTKEALRGEFEKFGLVMDVFLKGDSSEPGRMWGFVTYNDAGAAAAAVSALHERLVLPGGSRPCAVSFARNSQAQHSLAAATLSGASGPAVSTGQTKLFIGSIPQGTTEALMRSEFEKFGMVTEVFLKHDSSDPNRMWGFLSYAAPESAAIAVSALHEKLMLPGSIRPLAVSFARSGGPKGGAAATPGLGGLSALAPQPTATAPTLVQGASVGGDWKLYYTPQGLPYYNNAVTGQTQWEAPAEVVGAAGLLSSLASPGATAPQAGGLFAAVPTATGTGAERYSPY